MEDAAPAEISRAQVWQWLRHGAVLLTPEGTARALTSSWFLQTLDEELGTVRREVGDSRFAQGCFTEARALFERLCTSNTFEPFLTLPAYEELLRLEAVT